jgi:hypothetical protein
MRRSGRARGDRCDPTGGLAAAPRAPSRGLGAEGWRSPQAQTHVGPGRLTGAPRQGWRRAPPSAGFGKRIRLFEENPRVGSWRNANLQVNGSSAAHTTRRAHESSRVCIRRRLDRGFPRCDRMADTTRRAPSYLAVTWTAQWNMRGRSGRQLCGARARRRCAYRACRVTAAADVRCRCAIPGPRCWRRPGVGRPDASGRAASGVGPSRARGRRRRRPR